MDNELVISANLMCLLIWNISTLVTDILCPPPDVFIDMKELQSQREMQTEKSAIHWFTPHMGKIVCT